MIFIMKTETQRKPKYHENPAGFGRRGPLKHENTL